MASQIQVKISDEVAQAFRRYVLETKGNLRGMNEIVEQALKEFLESRGKLQIQY